MDTHHLSTQSMPVFPTESSCTFSICLLKVNDLLSSTSSIVMSMTALFMLTFNCQNHLPFFNFTVTAGQSVHICRQILETSWRTKKRIQFNAFKTQSSTLSNKKSEKSPPVVMNDRVLESNESAKELGFPFRVRIFSPYFVHSRCLLGEDQGLCSEEAMKLIGHRP